MNEKKLTKKKLTVLKKLRILNLIIYVIMIVVWFFLPFTLWELVNKMLPSDAIFNMLITAIMWLFGFIIISGIFTTIKFRYCFVTRKEIAKYIDDCIHQDIEFVKLLLIEMTKRGNNFSVKEIDDFNNSDDDCKVIMLNENELFRNCYESKGLPPLITRSQVMKSYVSYELLAYVYFEIRECKKIVNRVMNSEAEKMKQAEAEETSRKRQVFEESVFTENKRNSTK